MFKNHTISRSRSRPSLLFAGGGCEVWNNVDESGCVIVIENIESPSKWPKASRPKKKQKRATDEPRAPTKTFTNRCQTCKSIGHNMRTCPLTVQDTAEPSSKRKKASRRASKLMTEFSQPSTVASAAVSVNPPMQAAANAPPRFVPDGCSQIGFVSNP